MKKSETKEFIAYEYLKINILSNKEELYIDCYKNFGWQLINNSYNDLVDEEDYYINNYDNRLVTLKFKRDRRIPNKNKINLLQNKCEKSLKELIRLEKEPIIKSTIYSLTLSIIGIIFMTISIFLIINYSLFIGTIPGIISLILCGLSYPIYIKTKVTKKEINKSLIEEKYNIIYDSCNQARKLID